MHKMIRYFIVLAVCASLFQAQSVHAALPDDFVLPEPSPEDWMRGEVTKIEVGDIETDPVTQQTGQIQKVTVRVTTGKNAGTIATTNYGGSIATETLQPLQVGDTVVLNKGQDMTGQSNYAIVDAYRLTPMYWLVAVFFLCVIILGRVRGVSSILGLVITIILLIKWIIPHILSGESPLLISSIGAVIIVLLSLYLAHGFNKRTTIAVGSTLLVLALSIGLATLYTWLTHLTGAGSEEALMLRVGQFPNLNLRGLLLGGMIIGVLGVLDDITTGQSAAVEELHKANPSLPFHELYRRAFSIGREHIASLVNTLVLAYAGASLPLLLLFSTNIYQPFWVTLNSQPMIEEIVRTLVGSMALILAVPLTTVLAAYIFSRQQHQRKTT